MKKIFIFVFIVGVAFLFGFLSERIVGAEHNHPKDKKEIQLAAASVPQTGQQAPDFTLKDATGKGITLSSYKGRVVMINFWATWCPPCRQEMPSMEMLFQEYNKKGFEILAISSDSQGEKIVKPFMEFYELSFTALMDTDGKVHSVYAVTAIPTTYIVDKKGAIAQKIMGPKDWKDKDSKNMIEKLLQ
ncbi:MAG: TlpA disulfide reductase family protein [Nitrospirota bacterium]